MPLLDNDIIGQLDAVFSYKYSSKMLRGIPNDDLTPSKSELVICSLFEEDIDSHQIDMANFIEGGSRILPLLKSIQILNSKMEIYYNTNSNKYFKLVDNIKCEIELIHRRINEYNTLCYNAMQHFKCPDVLHSIHCQYNAFYSIFRILQYNFIVLQAYYSNQTIYDIIKKSHPVSFDTSKPDIHITIIELILSK